jgi:cyclopropane-fatty-acyl-phospholipid synthase
MLPDSSPRMALDTPGVRPAPRSRFDRWLLGKVLQWAGNPPLLIVLWNGEVIHPPGVQPKFTVRIRDRQTLWRLLINPDMGFGEGYSEGCIEVEGDLIAFMELMQQKRWRTGPLSKLLARLGRPWQNTLGAARGNVQHHYDLGNDFYRLWLDEEMVYTCAYFPTRDDSLEEAQRAKMDHVCRKLRLRPGQTVIEAGCGWGALARHMTKHYGVRVRAFNISHEQIVYARERAKAEGLDGRVEYVEEDYRKITGSCDAFVSVGMLEHVGLRNYRRLGGVIKRCLKPDGLGLIHSLGRNRAENLSPWIQKRIFPGAHIPSLKEMMAIFEPWDFSVLDVENLRLHYAKTTEHWLKRFDRVAAYVAEKYGERFVRTWRLYLAGSTGAFLAGSLQLFQIVFSAGANSCIPWTRFDVYADGAEERR